MDTIMIIRDSVATCMNKTVATCQPCVKEAGTTWQDVSIVFLVCLTLLIIALYAICNYYKCKKNEREASAVSAKMKRDNDVEDRKWKLRVDLKDKMLRHLESLIFDTYEIEEENVVENITQEEKGIAGDQQNKKEKKSIKEQEAVEEKNDEIDGKPKEELEKKVKQNEKVQKIRVYKKEKSKAYIDEIQKAINDIKENNQ